MFQGRVQFFPFGCPGSNPRLASLEATRRFLDQTAARRCRAKSAFVGLGHMGHGGWRQILWPPGAAVIAYVRSVRNQIGRLVALGPQAHGRISPTCFDCEVVISMLPDGRRPFRDVVFGRGGISGIDGLALGLMPGRQFIFR